MTLTSLIAVLALLGAVSAQEPEQPVLAGTSWTLSALGDVPAVPGRNSQNAHIVFDVETVSVFYGCNFGRGPYAADSQGALSMPHLNTTRRRCQDPIMQMEMRFGRALRDATHFTITDGQLELFDAQERLVATLDQHEDDQHK